MENELPNPIVNLAESLGGKIVRRRAQVGDTDIIVAVSCSHSSQPQSPVTVIFFFADESARQEFKRQFMTGYGQPELFRPWTLGEYLSQPAGDYFSKIDK